MRPTINQLTESKTFYRRNKDFFGNRTKEAYQKEMPRKVELVTGWLRFGHYILDGLIIAVVLIGLDILLLHDYNLGLSDALGTNGLVYNFIPTLDSIIVTAGYYSICEGLMQTTIGKLATNSVVINQYAEKPDNASLIGRSFARLVPFEPFSCLGDRGWHDKWSNTYVVTTQERDVLRKLLNEREGIYISDNPDLLD